MAETQIAQIQVRRDTAANWTSEDPTLASGAPRHANQSTSVYFPETEIRR